MDWSFSLTGFVVGLLVGLTGVGGGALLTPLLIMVYGISPLIAVGTDLVFAAITKFLGAWTHSRQGTVVWPVVGLMSLGSLPAALITTSFLAGLDHDSVDQLVRGVLGFGLLLSALALLFRPWIRARMLRSHQGLSPRTAQLRRVLTVLAGAGLGVLVSLSSIGAGALGAVILILLYPRMTAVRMVGTDIAHAVPLAAVAGFGHYQLGSVDMALLLVLLLGSLPGIYLGARLSALMPERITRTVLASVLFTIGVRFMV